MDKNELMSRMKADHLEGLDVNDMKSELELAVDKQNEMKKENQKIVRDPKNNKEYTFNFSWKDANGKLWEGKFTNKILSVGEQSMVGVMRARLAAGAPLESLDALTIEINLMIAHMTFSLTEKPSWAEDLRSLLDVGLLQAIYMEVSSHEAFFFGRKAFAEEGGS